MKSDLSGHVSTAAGIAAASVAAHITSLTVALISLETTPIFPVEFNNPEYLALLLWIAVAAVSSICFVAALLYAARSMRYTRLCRAVDCFELSSEGMREAREIRPKVKHPGNRTQ